MVGEVDGGLHEIGPGELAEAFVELIPSFDTAGHGDRVDAGLRHGFVALRFEEVDGEAGGGPAAGVEGGELAGFGVPVDGEEVAADAVAFGLDDAEYGVSGDGGVDGGSAAGQYLRAGLGGEGLAGGDDPAIGDDHGARLRSILRVRANYEERKGDEERGTHGF